MTVAAVERSRPRDLGLPLAIARKILGAVAVLFVVSLIVFSLQYFAPGSVERTVLGGRSATPEAIAAVRAEYNLDEPFAVQYLLWLKGAVVLDLGSSIQTSQPVLEEIRSRLGVTVPLALMAFFATMFIGVPLGVISGYRARSKLDRTIVVSSVAAISAPVFATGILLLYLFAVAIPVFPPFGRGEGIADRAMHLALPAVALALSAIAFVVKLTRSATIEVIDQDFVTFARARGVSGRRISRQYVLRSALVSITTAAGLVLGSMLAGTVIVEVTFALPGIGSMLVEAVNGKDIPVVQGVAVTVAFLIVLVNLVTDLLYLLIDPRIRIRDSGGQ